MAVTLLASIGLAIEVTGLLVRSWWLASLAAAPVGLASAAGEHVPTPAALDGRDAMALVAGMVVVAAAAERSGLLAAAGEALTDRVHRPRALLALAFLLAVVVTTPANLDTTAVLFTPVAIEVALAAAVPIIPSRWPRSSLRTSARCCCRPPT